MAFQRWEKEKEEELITLINKNTKIKNIAKKLNKSENAIRLKAKKLGLTIKETGCKWTTEEEDLLIEDWANDKLTLDYIAKKHNRTIQAIKLKAMKMELGPRAEYIEHLTIDIIAEEFGIHRDKVERWIKNGLKCSEKRIGKHKYIIDSDDLLEWLKNNQDKFNAANLSIYLFATEPQWLKDKRKNDIALKTINKNNNKEWTNSEDLMLQNFIKQGISYDKIAKRLGRTESACIGRATIVGVAKDNPKFWQDKEIKILKEYSDIKTISELQKLLPNRTEKAIEYKCKMLGLKYHLTEKRIKKG